MNPARDIQPYKNKQHLSPSSIPNRLWNSRAGIFLLVCAAVILYCVILVSPPLRTSLADWPKSLSLFFKVSKSSQIFQPPQTLSEKLLELVRPVEDYKLWAANRIDRRRWMWWGDRCRDLIRRCSTSVSTRTATSPTPPRNGCNPPVSHRWFLPVLPHNWVLLCLLTTRRTMIAGFWVVRVEIEQAQSEKR